MDFWGSTLPLPVALAIVATLGYLFGRQQRHRSEEELSQRSRRELRRAQQVAQQLERIAATVRRSLAEHHASVDRFKHRVGQLAEEQRDAAFKDLCREAEEVLRPTMRLATEIANAYDEIRQQSSNLMTFTEVRSDPLTGLNNRRGLDEALSTQFALAMRYGTPFAVAIFDIDNFKGVNDKEGHLYGDRMLQELGRLLDDTARETDVVARYGGEEFIVVMPQTDFYGGCVFAERMRACVENALPLTISGGVTPALDGDTADSLLARADAALYGAKAAGRNRVYRHDGTAVGEATVETAEA